MTKIKKMPDTAEDIFRTGSVQVPEFGAAEVVEILEIENWRLQKFLSGKTFQLSAEGRVGKRGQGSRRIFSLEDTYRLGIADYITKDGYSPKWISSLLQRIEDEDMFSFDSEGELKTLVIRFRRKGKQRVLEFNPPQRTENDGEYYRLDLGVIIDAIDKRVREVRISNRKEQ